MSKIIFGDILDIKKGIIVHQVNCQGVMGAGLAKQIKEKWPDIFKRYRDYVSQLNYGNPLGLIQIIKLNDNLYVINLFGQYNYGRKRVCYTDYKAHESAWKEISFERKDKRCNDERSCLYPNFAKLNIYVPFYIGAGLAGGDWKRIHKIAEKYVPDIIWVKYKKG